jgi:hypothetical protein
MDKQNEQENTIPEEKQVDAMLTSDQTTEEQVAEEELTLPDGVSERTRQQFEKLKERNRILAQQLKEKTESKEKPVHSSVLEDAVETYAPQFSNLSNDQVQATAQALIDQDGYLDEIRLQQILEENNRKVQEALERAKKAEAKIATFEQQSVMDKVHAKYPQLDPYSPEFDPNFYDFVRNDLLGQMAKGTKDVMAAAKKAEQFFSQVYSQNKAAPKPEKRVPDQTVRSYSHNKQNSFQNRPLTIEERLKLSGY